MNKNTHTKNAIKATFAPQPTNTQDGNSNTKNMDTGVTEMANEILQNLVDSYKTFWKLDPRKAKKITPRVEFIFDEVDQDILLNDCYVKTALDFYNDTKASDTANAEMSIGELFLNENGNVNTLSIRDNFTGLNGEYREPMKPLRELEKAQFEGKKVYEISGDIKGMVHDGVEHKTGEALGRHNNGGKEALHNTSENRLFFTYTLRASDDQEILFGRFSCGPRKDKNGISYASRGILHKEDGNFFTNTEARSLAEKLKIVRDYGDHGTTFTVISPKADYNKNSFISAICQKLYSAIIFEKFEFVIRDNINNETIVINSNNISQYMNTSANLFPDMEAKFQSHFRTTDLMRHYMTLSDSDFYVASGLTPNTMEFQHEDIKSMYKNLQKGEVVSVKIPFTVEKWDSVSDQKMKNKPNSFTDLVEVLIQKNDFGFVQNVFDRNTLLIHKETKTAEGIDAYIKFPKGEVSNFMGDNEVLNHSKWEYKHGWMYDKKLWKTQGKSVEYMEAIVQKLVKKIMEAGQPDIDTSFFAEFFPSSNTDNYRKKRKINKDFVRNPDLINTVERNKIVTVLDEQMMQNFKISTQITDSERYIAVELTDDGKDAVKNGSVISFETTAQYQIYGDNKKKKTAQMPLIGKYNMVSPNNDNIEMELYENGKRLVFSNIQDPDFEVKFNNFDDIRDVQVIIEPLS